MPKLLRLLRARPLAFSLLALFAMVAHAGVGVRILPATDAEHGPVTLWYPSAEAESQRAVGAFELATLNAPVGLVEASADRVLAPAFHVQALKAACPGCQKLAVLPGAGHDAFFSPWPAALAARAGLSGPEAAGFDRKAQLPGPYRTIARIFEQHL